MPRAAKIVWLAFLVLVAAAWANFTFVSDGSSDGAGACAIMGFGIFVLLLLATLLDALIRWRRRRAGR